MLANRTLPQYPQTTDKLYWYVDNGFEHPCLYVKSEWPDLRHRLFLQNQFLKVVDQLKSKLENIEGLIMKQSFKKYITELEFAFKDAFCFVSNSCSKLISDIRVRKPTFVTKLDKNRYQMRSSELEESWPNVYVTMIYENKKIAFQKFSPNLILYSVNSKEKGNLCGVRQTIPLKPAKYKKKIFMPVTCMLDMVLWIGLDSQKDFFFREIPSCYSLSTNYSDKGYPSYLQSKEHHDFQARVHIYQGKFSFGSDKSGLCDPFVRIIIGNESRETENKVQFLGRCTFAPKVKCVHTPYKLPEFPPKLQWCKIWSNSNSVTGEIMISSEILELTTQEIVSNGKKRHDVIRVPSDVKPNNVKYRIEVLFWGIRDLNKELKSTVVNPKAILECAYATISSDRVHVMSGNLNFQDHIKQIDVNLPDELDYIPPLCLKLVDKRPFGRYVLVGIQLFDMLPFLYEPETSKQRYAKIFGKHYDRFDDIHENLAKNLRQAPTSSKLSKTTSSVFDVHSKENKTVENEINQSRTPEESTKRASAKRPKKNAHFKSHELGNTQNVLQVYNVETKMVNALSKYPKPFDGGNGYLQLDEFDDAGTSLLKPRNTETYVKKTKSEVAASKRNDEHLERLLTVERQRSNWEIFIYPSELENQPEFEEFKDSLKTFFMLKENRTGDDMIDEQYTKATVKAAIQIYRLPENLQDDYVTPTGRPLVKGMFQDFVSNEPQQFLLRVYCVKAFNLPPRDINGKSDPYLQVIMGKQCIKDRENYVPKQINPTFGRCFELNGGFPHNHIVKVQVWDYDKATSDDLIGETKIDIENRFYTKYRAECGLAEHYYTTGYCQWRDYKTPTRILKKLCRDYNLGFPEYIKNGVKIGTKIFSPLKREIEGKLNKQDLALYALRHWKEFPVVGFELVPEHIETRSLYHPAKPGIEQGKLQMWIDIFPFMSSSYPEMVNITPRKPIPYELRIVIWNTEDVILDDDDFFIGEKMSDIYVKGWLVSSREAQCTDIHYRSMSGEGNFNWRFIFRFQYLPTENLIVIKKKDDSEYKIPCRLTLQIWDKDALSADDFLGTVSLELAKLPRGAPYARNCSLNILKDGAPRTNLFRKKRTRGWWPVPGVNQDPNVETLAGKIDIEFELVDESEAILDPAGLGRSDPHSLTKPMRPSTSFSWFKNPHKALYAILCQQNKWRCFKCLLCATGIFFICAWIGVMPKFILQKLASLNIPI
ncbi:hypothetical protein FQR65_LT04705 [Abscondita terminalis]|nr:hypothetical protein FQR65_LT04705 [Abscondita terminalis]